MKIANLNNNNHQEENQNANNEFINHNSLYNQEELNYSLKYTKITISFIILLLLKVFFSIYFNISNSSEKYIFQYYLIIYYNQYYRCITRYFINFGICHLIIELVLLYKMCFYFENMLGTLFTIILVFVSLILISFVNLVLISFIKSINIFQKYNLDIMYEGGLTPLLFTLYTFFFCFDGNSYKSYLIFFSFVFRIKHSERILITVLFFLTPNESPYGNLSGIFTAYILKSSKNYILPKIIWVKEIENIFLFYKLFPLYRYITENNPLMKKILFEYDSDSLEQINSQNEIGFTLISSENDNIDNNNSF